MRARARRGGGCGERRRRQFQPHTVAGQQLSVRGEFPKARGAAKLEAVVRERRVAKGGGAHGFHACRNRPVEAARREREVLLPFNFEGGAAQCSAGAPERPADKYAHSQSRPGQRKGQFPFGREFHKTCASINHKIATIAIGTLGICQLPIHFQRRGRAIEVEEACHLRAGGGILCWVVGPLISCISGQGERKKVFLEHKRGSAVRAHENRNCTPALSRAGIPWRGEKVEALKGTPGKSNLQEGSIEN